MSDWTDMPYERAVAYLRGLRPMTDADFANLEAEVAARAFTVARVTKIEMLQQILDKLNAGLTGGLTLQEFASDMNVIVDGALTDGHLETIYRTNLQSAYGAGKWEQITDPDIASEVWGWEFTTMQDDLVREEHAALEGLQFAIGDGDQYFPPIDYNCRCSGEAVLLSEAGQDATSDPVPEDVQAYMSENDFSSPALNLEYRPDLSGVHPSILADYANDSSLN